MGIKDLLKLLRDDGNLMERIKLGDLSKSKIKRVAVDCYVWLHKAASKCSDELVQGMATGRYIDFFMKEAKRLLDPSNGIEEVYFVFDGAPLPLKAGTNDARAGTRGQAFEQVLEHLEKDERAKAQQEMKKALRITRQMAYNVIQALKLYQSTLKSGEKIHIIVAPYEADGQLAFLDHQKLVDAVISSDSDLLAFGVRRLLTSPHSPSDAKDPTLYEMYTGFGAGLENWVRKPAATKAATTVTRKLSLPEFQYMCILSGCDYTPSLGGMGLLTAHEIVCSLKPSRQAVDVDQLLAAVKASGFQVPERYREWIINASLGFNHQRVYDPQVKKIRSLRPLPSDDTEDRDPMAFLGPKHFNNMKSLVERICSGEIDPVTVRTYETYSSQVPEADIPPEYRSEAADFRLYHARLTNSKAPQQEVLLAETPKRFDLSKFFLPPTAV